MLTLRKYARCMVPDFSDHGVGVGGPQPCYKSCFPQVIKIEVNFKLSNLGSSQSSDSELWICLNLNSNSSNISISLSDILELNQDCYYN